MAVVAAVAVGGKLIPIRSKVDRMVVVRSGDFFYRGPKEGLKEALHLHYQVSPRRVTFDMSNNGSRFSYSGDAKDFDAVRAVWEEHCTESAGVRAWKDAHGCGQRVLRFLKETVSLFRELF